MSGRRTIEAAGGAVWRMVGDDAQVLVVHRPRYDDWSLPKGKLDPGESALEGALREVEEETGLRCRPGAELATVRYLDRKRRPKRVRYWAMAPDSGSFTPNAEVDEVRWLDLDAARQALSYGHDGPVLDALEAALDPGADLPVDRPSSVA